MVNQHTGAGDCECVDSASNLNLLRMGSLTGPEPSMREGLGDFKWMFLQNRPGMFGPVEALMSQSGLHKVAGPEGRFGRPESAASSLRRVRRFVRSGTLE
jgi:hypothetical protein